MTVMPWWCRVGQPVTAGGWQASGLTVDPDQLGVIVDVAPECGHPCRVVVSIGRVQWVTDWPTYLLTPAEVGPVVRHAGRQTMVMAPTPVDTGGV